MKFRNDIQGLRAIAFITVFIFHLNKDWLPGGFLGVDMFFVISGYLITKISIGHIDNGKFSFTDFYIKRLKRIAPAYFVLLAAVAIAVTYFYLWTDIQAIRSTLFKSAFFLSNTVFANGESYFGATLVQNPLLHTWSLAIEMQFYLILPIILVMFRKKLKLVLVIITLLCIAFISYQIYAQEIITQSYFSLVGRIPEFLIGSFYAISFPLGFNLKRTESNTVALGSLLVLGVSMFIISEEISYPGILSFIPCLATANLLTINNNSISDLFSTKIPVYIGKLSYSLYLWHWPIMAFIRYSNDEYVFNISNVAIICVLTFILSVLSFYIVEDTVRKTTTTKFFKLSIPFGVALLLFINYLPLMTASKKIPEYFTKPQLGLKSHYDGDIEKFGNLQKNDSIILIGDSHALMIKPFLDYIGKKNEFSFQTLTCDAYPAINGIKAEEVSKNSLHFLKYSKTLIPKTKHLISENSIIIMSSTSFTQMPSLKNSLESLVKNLRKNQDLILISTFPALDKNPFKLNKGITKKTNKRISFVDKKENKDFLLELSEKYSNVHVYDLSKSKIFENGPYVNDTITYYNNGHINNFGSLKMAEDLESDFVMFLSKIRKKKRLSQK